MNPQLLKMKKIDYYDLELLDIMKKVIPYELQQTVIKYYFNGPICWYCQKLNCEECTQ